MLAGGEPARPSPTLAQVTAPFSNSDSRAPAQSRVRPARPDDIPEILRLVRELAAYEREPDAVEATPEGFAAALFPDAGAPTAYAHVAELDGRVVGMAVWYVTFSTWLGRSGIWLEDLYVEPQHRGSGSGKALLRTLAEICAERGYGRLEWWVLRWNEDALAFYRSLGAVPQQEWEVYRLDGAALGELGGHEGGDVAEHRIGD